MKKVESKEVLEVLDRMITCGFSLNKLTYSMLNKFLCLEGKINDAYELMDKMIKEGHLSKDQIHNLFMNYLIRSNNIDKAEKLLSNMLESGIKPNGLTFNTLIKGICFVGGFSDALSWHMSWKRWVLLLILMHAPFFYTGYAIVDM